jgi:hypothetical protein
MTVLVTEVHEMLDNLLVAVNDNDEKYTDISANKEQVCDITWEEQVGGRPTFFDLKWAASERWWYSSG